MRVFLKIQDKAIPVYTTEKNANKKLKLLEKAIHEKLVSGRNAIKASIETLISIEIIDSEAILHSFHENKSFALSLY